MEKEKGIIIKQGKEAKVEGPVSIEDAPPTPEPKPLDPLQIFPSPLRLGEEWRCPACSGVIERKTLRKPDEGGFPDDYDYTLYENDGDFLLSIINHVCTHIEGVKVEMPSFSAVDGIESNGHTATG